MKTHGTTTHKTYTHTCARRSPSSTMSDSDDDVPLVQRAAAAAVAPSKPQPLQEDSDSEDDQPLAARAAAKPAAAPAKAAPRRALKDDSSSKRRNQPLSFLCVSCPSPAETNNLRAQHERGHGGGVRAPDMGGRGELSPVPPQSARAGGQPAAAHRRGGQSGVFRRGLRRAQSIATYSTATTSRVSSPPGVRITTVSPSRALSSWRASGEIQLMRPRVTSASSMPTMA